MELRCFLKQVLLIYPWEPEKKRMKKSLNSKMIRRPDVNNV